MKRFFNTLLKKHPLGVLYGTLLGILAFSAAIPMFTSGVWDAALVDLTMAVILVMKMLKKFIHTSCREANLPEKSAAWGMLIFANILTLLQTHDFPGSLCTAFACALLLCALVLFFSGSSIAVNSIAPALWCCVFMPFHEELMLLLSYPLRLSATALSAFLLKLFGVKVLYSGTSLDLSGLNIAITDACSGINQLDAFILIAFVAVQILHNAAGWKVLHFAFIVPAIIIGNSLRIVLTVLLYTLYGEVILQNTWHTVLGYVQIAIALLFFLAVGKLFAVSDAVDGEGMK